MNSTFMSNVELDAAIARAEERLHPLGFRSRCEQELRELHYGALVQVKAMREMEASR